MNTTIKDTLRLLDNYIDEIKQDISIRESKVKRTNEEGIKTHQEFMIKLRKDDIRRITENKKALQVMQDEEV